MSEPKQVHFYGGPHDNKTFLLKRTPPRVPICVKEWDGVYRLREVLGEPCYQWGAKNGKPASS